MFEILENFLFSKYKIYYDMKCFPPIKTFLRAEILFLINFLIYIQLS